LQKAQPIEKQQNLPPLLILVITSAGADNSANENILQK